MVKVFAKMEIQVIHQAPKRDMGDSGTDSVQAVDSLAANKKRTLTYNSKYQCSRCEIVEETCRST